MLFLAGLYSLIESVSASIVQISNWMQLACCICDVNCPYTLASPKIPFKKQNIPQTVEAQPLKTQLIHGSSAVASTRQA